MTTTAPESAETPLPPAAQTNLALYKQLHRLGYDAAALLAIRDAYALATTLFAGRCRASGKPFLCHLVGTASILAALGASPATVTAGLVHAAYEQGDFGLMRWREKRRRVRDAIGEAAEALAWRYQALAWHEATIPRLHDALTQPPDAGRPDTGLTEADRTVILMRLANELDDHFDLEMRHCHPARDEHRGRRAVLVAMARALGQPALANSLNAAYCETDEAEWARALSFNRRASYRPRPPFGSGVAGLLRSVLGR